MEAQANSIGGRASAGDRQLKTCDGGTEHVED